MSTIFVEKGGTALLHLRVADGTAGLFPQASVRDTGGSHIAGSPFNLTDDGGGRYSTTISAPAPGVYEVDYISYTDSYGGTPSTTIDRVSEQLFVDDGRAVLDAALADHLVAGSIGETLVLISGHAGDNVRDDALSYDGNNRPTSIRRRIFPNAATANASTAGGTGEGEILTVTITATHFDAARWQSLLRTV